VVPAESADKTYLDGNGVTVEILKKRLEFSTFPQALRSAYFR
jgi:hypothetical protein